jgi:hypothetical protein
MTNSNQMKPGGGPVEGVGGFAGIMNNLLSVNVGGGDNYFFDLHWRW